MPMNSKISESESSRQRRAAFTLLELLVVIGTVVLLSSVLLSALASSKPNSIVAQCLENQRRLAQAFVLYTADYNGAIVPEKTMDGFILMQPNGMTWNKSGQTADASLQNFRKTVNSATNLLFAYGASSDVIRCPGDFRYRNAPGAGWACDSYSKTENVGGDSSGGFYGQGATYTNLSQVTAPANTFAFREDVDSRGFNAGPWVLQWYLTTPQSGHSQSFEWLDPNPMYHGDVSTAAFVDGHAELHKWMHRTMIQYGLLIASGGPGLYFGPINGPFSGPDYEYVYQNFRFPGWQP